MPAWPIQTQTRPLSPKSWEEAGEPWGVWLPRPACGRVERLALATTLGPLQVPGTLSPPADSHLPTHHFSVTPPTATLLPQGQLVTMAQQLLGAGRAQEAVLGGDGGGWRTGL